MKRLLLLGVLIASGCRTVDSSSLFAFQRELNSYRIDMPTDGTGTVSGLAACLQSRANAVLPSSSPIHILVVHPNVPVHEESFAKAESNVMYFDRDLPIDDLLRIYTTLLDIKMEYAPKSRTIIWYWERQPDATPLPGAPAAGPLGR